MGEDREEDAACSSSLAGRCGAVRRTAQGMRSVYRR